MPILAALPDPDRPGCYRMLPFPFETIPFVQGIELDRDIDVYLAHAMQRGMMLSWGSLVFIPEAATVFLRRAGDPGLWAAFLAEAERRRPALRTAMTAAAANLAKLATGDRSGATSIWRPTLPEILFGSALQQRLPRRVTLSADQPVPGARLTTGHVPRCDFECKVVNRDRILRIEVLGLIDRFGEPRTAEGVRYKGRLRHRLNAYDRAGLDRPITVGADEVYDPVLLLAAVERVLAALKALQN